MGDVRIRYVKAYISFTKKYKVEIMILTCSTQGYTPLKIRDVQIISISINKTFNKNDKIIIISKCYKLEIKEQKLKS